jgi:hypothetical protein
VKISSQEVCLLAVKKLAVDPIASFWKLWGNTYQLQQQVEATEAHSYSRLYFD